MYVQFSRINACHHALTLIQINIHLLAAGTYLLAHIHCEKAGHLLSVYLSYCIVKPLAADCATINIIIIKRGAAARRWKGQGDYYPHNVHFVLIYQRAPPLNTKCVFSKRCDEPKFTKLVAETLGGLLAL